MEQIVPTCTNTGDPLLKELPADANPLFEELGNRGGERGVGLLLCLRDAFEHKSDTRLLAWESVIGKNAFTGLALLTASQTDPQLLRSLGAPKPPDNPAEGKHQKKTPATGTVATIEDLIGRCPLDVFTISQDRRV